MGRLKIIVEYPKVLCWDLLPFSLFTYDFPECRPSNVTCQIYAEGVVLYTLAKMDSGYV